MLDSKILDVIKSKLETSPDRDLVLDDYIEELGINSISYIDVIVDLEEAFNIEIDDDRLFFPRGEKLSYIVQLVREMIEDVILR